MENPLILVHSGVYQGEFLVIDGNVTILGAAPGNVAEHVVIERSSESTIVFGEGARDTHLGYLTLKVSIFLKIWCVMIISFWKLLFAPFMLKVIQDFAWSGHPFWKRLCDYGKLFENTTNSIDDTSALAQVMVCCCQAPSHYGYLNPCWYKSMMLHGIQRRLLVSTVGAQFTKITLFKPMLTRIFKHGLSLAGGKTPAKQKPGPHLNIKTVLSTYGDFHVKDKTARLNIKTVLSTYGDFHVKDKTAVRTSYLWHGNCHTW